MKIQSASPASLLWAAANDKIDAVIDGNRVEIGFNNRFMLEALKVVDTDEVRIELNGAVSPILILPPEGDSFLFLVLPVRLKRKLKVDRSISL